MTRVWAAGTHTIQLSEDSAVFIQDVVKRGLAEQNVHILELAVALGLRRNERRSIDGPKKDVSKVGQFDPAGFFTSLILERYPKLPEGDRVRAIAEHAEAGIEAIMTHLTKNGWAFDEKMLLRGTKGFGVE